MTASYIAEVFLIKAIFLSYFWVYAGSLGRGLKTLLVVVSTIVVVVYTGVFIANLSACQPFRNNW